MILVPLMNLFAIGCPDRRVIVVADSSVDIVDNDVACTCRAVVVEVIIAIVAVLWQVVCENRLHDLPLLLIGEIEQLLAYATVIVIVALDKVFPCLYLHAVVGESKGKP